VLDQRGSEVDGSAHSALIGIAEEGRDIDGGRPPLERGDAAIGHAGIVQVLVAERDPRPLAGRDGESRIEGVALETHLVAEAVRALVHAVETKSEPARQGLIDVRRHSLAAVGAALQGDLVNGLEARLLGDPIDDAPAPAPAEDHRVRSLERFHALEVVEVAVVLDVVAHAVQEEIRGRVVAADDDLVAVVLPLVRPHPREVADDVGHARHELVLDELLRGDGDGLRDVPQRRQSARRAADGLHLIAGRRRAHRHRLVEAGDAEDELA
jgi:hypothetical protein